MKKILSLISILFLCNFCFSQTIMSWNIQNLGETKYKKDSIILKISEVIKSSNADIIAVQELVTSNWGDSCIIKLSKILSLKYSISSKTIGPGSERYVFLWKNNVKMVKTYLEKSLQDSIDREPFTGIFEISGKQITIRQVHLVPATKNPQYEVSKLYKFNDETDIICGDFNLTSKHIIYVPILVKKNSPLSGQKTTLKRDGNISENNFDHFLVSKKLTIKSAKVYIYPFKGNRNILSDHLPILLTL